MKKEKFNEFWDAHLKKFHAKAYAMFVKHKVFDKQRNFPNDKEYFNATVVEYQENARDFLFYEYTKLKTLFKGTLYGFSNPSLHEIRMDQHKISAILCFCSLMNDFWKISHEDDSRIFLLREEFAYHISNQTILVFNNCHFKYLDSKNHPKTYGTAHSYKKEIIRYYSLIRKSDFRLNVQKNPPFIVSALLKMESFLKYHFESVVTRNALKI